MSSKTDKPPVTQKSREKLPFGKIQFVLNNLDDAQDDELVGFEKTPPNLLDFLTDCVDKGLDIKASYDTYSDGYQVSATGNWEGFPSAGYATSAFSRHNSEEALFVLWYKVAIVCQFDLSSAQGREKRTKERG